MLILNKLPAPNQSPNGTFCATPDYSPPLNVLHIGTDRAGTTSHHRRLTLERLLPGAEFSFIDTAAAFDGCSRLARSLAFRLTGGPAVRAVNNHLLARLAAFPPTFDLVWVDKAVFLREETVARLRERAKTLVHYTPDTAFFANRSRHYFRSGGLYDLHLTTKSFELETYERQFPASPVLLTSQGYQEGIHRPLVAFEEKEDVVAFVGLAEPSRFEVIDALLDAGVPVKLAGKGWKTFVRDRAADRSLRFVGEVLSGDDYVRFLSSSSFALGLLSKRFPELHTTRTFEIPACGTALLSERNEETSEFFSTDEAIFYEGTADLIRKIVALRREKGTLRKISEAGRKRVITDGRSYDALLADILRKLKFA